SAFPDPTVDADTSNNAMTTTVTFQQAPPLVVHIFSWEYRDQAGDRQTVNPLSISLLISNLQRMFPTALVDDFQYPFFDARTTTSGGAVNNAYTSLRKLRTEIGDTSNAFWLAMVPGAEESALSRTAKLVAGFPDRMPSYMAYLLQRPF